MIKRSIAIVLISIVIICLPARSSTTMRYLVPEITSELLTNKYRVVIGNIVKVISYPSDSLLTVTLSFESDKKKKELVLFEDRSRIEDAIKSIQSIMNKKDEMVRYVTVEDALKKNKNAIKTAALGEINGWADHYQIWDPTIKVGKRFMVIYSALKNKTIRKDSSELSSPIIYPPFLLFPIPKICNEAKLLTLQDTIIQEIKCNLNIGDSLQNEIFFDALCNIDKSFNPAEESIINKEVFNSYNYAARLSKCDTTVYKDIEFALPKWQQSNKNRFGKTIRQLPICGDAFSIYMLLASKDKEIRDHFLPIINDWPIFNDKTKSALVIYLDSRDDLIFEKCYNLLKNKYNYNFSSLPQEVQLRIKKYTDREKDIIRNNDNNEHYYQKK
jgi:hypothetical protein